jgi:hypothetical protein
MFPDSYNISEGTAKFPTCIAILYRLLFVMWEGKMFLYHGPLAARTTHPTLGCHVHIASHPTPTPNPPSNIGTDVQTFPSF